MCCKMCCYSIPLVALFLLRLSASSARAFFLFHPFLFRFEFVLPLDWVRQKDVILQWRNVDYQAIFLYHLTRSFITPSYHHNDMPKNVEKWANQLKTSKHRKLAFTPTPLAKSSFLRQSIASLSIIICQSLSHPSYEMNKKFMRARVLVDQLTTCL